MEGQNSPLAFVAPFSHSIISGFVFVSHLPSCCNSSSFRFASRGGTSRKFFSGRDAVFDHTLSSSRKRLSFSVSLADGSKYAEVLKVFKTSSLTKRVRPSFSAPFLGAANDICATASSPLLLSNAAEILIIMSRAGVTAATATAFGLIIAAHEAGHLYAAKSLGIRVTEFSIGFGPAIWQHQGPKTNYVLRAIPLGGYVQYPSSMSTSGGPDSDSDSDTDLYENQPRWKQAAVLSAGVVANLFSAYALLVGHVALHGQPVPLVRPGLEVHSAPLYERRHARPSECLRTGDIVLKIDGMELPVSSAEQAGELSERLTRKAQANEQVKLDVLRRRDDGAGVTSRPGFRPNSDPHSDLAVAEVEVVTITPHVSRDGVPSLLEGVSVRPRVDVVQTRPRNLSEALSMGRTELAHMWINLSAHQLQAMLSALSNAFGTARQGPPIPLATSVVTVASSHGVAHTVTVDKTVTPLDGTQLGVSGPIGIVSEASRLAQSDWTTLFRFFAQVSLEMAFFNLLPIPMTDGSKLLGLLLESLCGGPLPDELVSTANTLGTLFLMYMSLNGFFNDLGKIVIDATPTASDFGTKNLV